MVSHLIKGFPTGQMIPYSYQGRSSLPRKFIPAGKHFPTRNLPCQSKQILPCLLRKLFFFVSEIVPTFPAEHKPVHKTDRLVLLPAGLIGAVELTSGVQDIQGTPSSYYPVSWTSLLINIKKIIYNNLSIGPHSNIILHTLLKPWFSSLL